MRTRTILAAAMALLSDSPADALPVASDSYFETRVQTSTQAAGPDQWAPIAKLLSSDPLFTAFGLNAVQFQSGNQYAHTATLTIQNSPVRLAGTLLLNPGAGDGQPLASLISLTTAPDSGRDLSFGNLHALSVSLDAVVLNQGGPKLYARVKPSFTNAGSPAPYLVPVAGASGLAYTLVGSSLRLSDFAPDAAQLPFFVTMGVKSVTPGPGNTLSVSGTVNGKAVSLSLVAGQRSFVVTGDSLKASDFIADAARIPALNTYALKQVSYSTAALTVSGTVKGKAVTISRAAGQNAVTVTGAGVTLPDFVPAAASVSALSAFALDLFTYANGALTVAGRINGQAVTVSVAAGGQVFTASGPGLNLTALVPATASLPLLKQFVFVSMTRSAAAVTVTGSISASAVTVTLDSTKKTYTVTGDSLKAADFIAAAASVPFLKEFAFTRLAQTSEGFSIAGTVDGKSLTLSRDSAGKNFAIVGSSLALTDFVPEAAQVPVLSKFVFTGWSQTVAATVVSGAIDGKAVTVTVNPKGGFSLTADALTLADFVPGVGDMPFLNNFAFNGASYADNLTTVTGKIGTVAVSVAYDSAQKSFSVTGAGLTLANFVPSAASVPALSVFALDRFTYAAKALTLTGRVNGKALTISGVAGGSNFSASGPGLNLTALVPATASLPFLKPFAFVSMARTDTAVTVTGTISGATVTVTLDSAKKSYTVTGDSLKASNFIADAASVPFLNTFAFTGLSQTPEGFSISGTVDGKSLTLSRDSAGKDFTIVGSSLTLADFVPEATHVPALDKFAFTEWRKTAAATVVSGAIDGKAVTVTVNPKGGFSVVAAGLTLADFVPGVGDLPFLNTFAFEGASYADALTTVSGKIGAVAVSVAYDAKQKSFAVTGAGLTLANFVPAAASLPLLNQFSFTSLTRSSSTVSVAGTVGGKAASVTKNVAADSFTVAGAGLTLAGFIPDAAKIPVLGKFAFDSLTYAPGSLSVAGAINGRAVAVVQNSKDKTFVVTGADLKLLDFVPAVAGLTFLNKFAFDRLSYSTASLSVAGKINGKAVSVDRTVADNAGFTAKGDALTLGDIVPEASGLKAFDALSLSLVSVTAQAIQVDGALSGKPVQFIKTRGAASKVTVTAASLTLGDLYAPLATVPAINAVALEKLSLDGASVEAEVQLNGVTVDVVSHVSKGPGDNYVAVFFQTLDAATFIPAAQGHAVNDISLKNALFVVQSQGAPAKTVTAANLPGSLPSLVGWAKTDSFKLSPGVNIAADLDIVASGSVAAALKTAGVTAVSLPLRGTLSAATFKGMGGKVKGAANTLSAADKQSLLAGLSLSAPLPLPKLPAVASVVKISGPAVLSLNGGGAATDGPWSKVPAGLSAYKPAGDLDFSLQFGLDIVGAGVGKTLDALVSVDKGTHPGLTLLAVYDGVWNKPFDIPGLSLTGGGFKLSLESSKTPGGANDDLAFYASADLGSKKGVSISADLARANGKITLNYFELDGPFGLNDFPGGKKIPHADKFQLNTIKLSLNGLEAVTTFSGKTVRAFLFDAGASGAANWTFAVEQKNFKISELLPAAKNIKPLAAMTLPDAALIITEQGLTGTRAGMGVIAKDMLDAIFGNANVPVKLPAGVALLAGFDPASMGLLGKGLSRIGVHDDAVIMGEITGVFQGAPGMTLGFSMEKAGTTSGLPNKVMSYKSGIEPSFYLQWAAEDLEVGLKIPMMVKAGKDLLELAAALDLEFIEEGVGIKILAEMDGTWKNPFGVKGISLSNLKLDAAIDDAGEVQIGFAGDDAFGTCQNGKGPDCIDINLAISLKILLEDALPDGVAFAGTVNQLGVPAILDIAERLLKLPGQLSKIPVPFFTIKNAKLAFATPGATDPDLGLVSEGFAFAGTFNFMGKDLGQMSGSGGPTSGVTFKGKIDDIDLEVLKFKNNDVDIAVNLNPEFLINSNVDLLGATQKVKLDIQPPNFEFDVLEKFGNFGNADMTVRLSGFDLKKGTFDKNADIAVIGEFKETLVPWLEGEIKKGVDELRQSANAKLNADSAALRSAQSKVDDLNKQIAAVKAQDDKAKARADATIDSAQSRVNSLQGSYDHDIHEAHHCGSRWTHWACSPGWYVAAGATEVSLKVAQGALAAAKDMVAAAFDLDPRLAGLYAARDVAYAGLAVAQAVVTATEAVMDFVLKELESLIEDALKNMPFEVEQAILIGDLKDMIAKNAPLVLDLKFKMFGAEMHEYFALKIPDSAANIEFDASSFALLPALALDKMTEAALAKVDPSVRTWVHSHIAAKLAEAEATVRAQVEGEEAKYKDVLATFENGSAKYKKAFSDQAAIHAQLVAQTDLSDLMGPSLQYTNTYLAVGHSSLCLTVSKDGLNVIQADCKDDAVERWSTAKLDDGYVELKSKGLCLKARKGDLADSNEPLILSQCDKNDKHEQWKVLDTDGFYDMIVNRDAQKCLHFNTENANPVTAYAVWTSCLGADSQNFRDIPDAERPTWHAANALIKSQSNLCLSVSDATGADFKPTATNKEAPVYSRPCDGKNERFNYTELVNGDIKLVHAASGACLYPTTGATSLAIRPCDTGKDMLWTVNAKTENSFQLYNAYRGLCMMLPTPPKGSSATPAVLSACNRVPADGLMLDFAQ